MDRDYPISVFRAAAGSAVVRVAVFLAALWTGSLVGEFLLTHRWHEPGLMPVSTLVHHALAVAHAWGLVLLLALGWLFYVLLWRDAPIGWAAASVFLLQVASVGLFTPDWMRADDPNGWALAATLLATLLGSAALVMAARRPSDP